MDQARHKWAGKEYFSTGEAAEICCVSQQTIIRHFDSGLLRGHRVPGSRFRRIPRQELIRFLRDHDMSTDVLEQPVLRVLIVDDNRAMLERLTDLMDDAELVQWQTASSSFGAGVVTERFDPRLILVNPDVPGVDAESLCRELSSGREGPLPRVLIVGADLAPQDTERLIDAGADQAFEASRDMAALARRVEMELPGWTSTTKRKGLTT